MDRITRVLAEHDDTYVEVAKALFGEGAHELISKADPSKKQRNDRRMQNAALATNVVGSVAGPAALYSAVKNRQGGGIPRDIASSAGPRMAGAKNLKVKRVGQKINRGVASLNAPGNKKAKIAAGAAGATMVGLQAVNWGGDMLSAKLINDQKKKDVAKSSPDSADLHIPGARKPGGSARLVARALDDPKVRAGGRYVAEETKVRAVKVASTGKVKAAATGRSKVERVLSKSDDPTVDVTWGGEISKVDGDKRQAFGYCSVIELDGEPVVDRQGDYINSEELEKSAYDYVMKSRKGGDMHRRVGDAPFHGADLIESFVITDEKIEKMGLPQDTPRGWWVGFKVHDDELWSEVKKGNRKGFSIHGKGIRKDMAI